MGMRRKRPTIDDDGRTDCPLCGWSVETDADGRCSLGHRVGVVTSPTADALRPAPVLVGAAPAEADGARTVPAWQVNEAAVALGGLTDAATPPPRREAPTADDGFARFDEHGAWTAAPTAPAPSDEATAPLDALADLAATAPLPAVDPGDTPVDPLDGFGLASPTEAADPLDDLDAFGPFQATGPSPRHPEALAPAVDVDPLDGFDAFAPVDTTGPLDTLGALPPVDGPGGHRDEQVADTDDLLTTALLAGVNVRDPLAAFVLAGGGPSALDVDDLPAAPVTPAPASTPAAAPLDDGLPVVGVEDEDAADRTRRWRLLLAGTLGVAVGTAMVVGAAVVAPL